MSRAWVGVDFDGTIAEYPYQAGELYGRPIETMMKRVRRWIRQGIRVKIITARANYPNQLALVREWLQKNGLGDLEVTAAKDCDMIVMFDDRAVTVETNTGRILTDAKKLDDIGLPL